MAIETHEQPGALADQLDGGVLRLGELARLQPIEHPADRRLGVCAPLGVDGARDDQPVDSPSHRDVVEAQPFGLLLLATRLPNSVVLECAATLAGRGVGDPEAEAPIGQAEDLVRAKAPPGRDPRPRRRRP